MMPSVSTGESAAAPTSSVSSAVVPEEAAQDYDSIGAPELGRPTACEAEAPSTGEPTVNLGDVQPQREPLFPIPDLAAARSLPGGDGSKNAESLRTRVRALPIWRKIDGFQIAGAAVVLGIGWIIGANSFDRRADAARLGTEVRALSQRVAAVQSRAESSPRATAVRTLGEREVTLRNEIATLKSKIEAGNRLTQSRDSEMLASIARLQKDARIDQLASRIDRVEHQLSSPTPTGSIVLGKTAAPSITPAPASLSAGARPAAAPAKSAATHGSRSDDHEPSQVESRPEAAKIPSTGYVLRSVRHGVALVENRDGLHEVAPGDSLAGAGRVERIERRNGEWVVVTSQGLIDRNDY